MSDQVKKILIIEDDDLISQMYLASLDGSAFEVRLEKDGEAGWQAMQTYVPDLVIVDFMMPKLNGIEVIEKMRADLRLKGVPAIMMSSLMDDADKQKALTAGATVYWVKNEVGMADFELKISELLAQKSQTPLQ